MLAAGVAAVVNADGNDEKPPRKANKIAADASKPKRKPPRIDVEWTKRIWMTPEQWAQVPRNPYQKTPRREERPKVNHLRKYKRDHAIVKMAVYPDGRRCKIDGHSRSYVWQYLPDIVDLIPNRLEVLCYNVRNDEEAAALCKQCDSTDAVKKAADYVTGSFSLADIPTTSKFFERGSNIKASLAYAYETIMRTCDQSETEKIATSDEIEKHVDMFKDALTALDGINVHSRRLTAPFITAFLLAYYKHGNDIVNFFKKVNEGTHGRKQGDKYCVIGKLEYDRDKTKLGGRTDHFKMVIKVLGALDTYMEGAFRNPNYQPPVNVKKIMEVDLDVYLSQTKAKRTARGEERNSLLKEQKKKR